MGKNNDIPLEQRAHWRRVREVITEIAKYEDINIQNYDLFNIRAYDYVGNGMAGTNVSYNTDNGRSIFVEDNKYDIYEVPKITNDDNSPFGEFIFFIHDTSFDYYLFGIMTVSLNKSSSLANKIVTEKVHYKNYGKYMITYEEHNNNINKVEFGVDYEPGFLSSNINYTYDQYNSRKHAYNTSNHKILRDLGVAITSPKKLAGNQKTQVYNKNKKGLGKGTSKKKH